jgi:hypothetical protein
LNTTPSSGFSQAQPTCVPHAHVFNEQLLVIIAAAIIIANIIFIFAA